MDALELQIKNIRAKLDQIPALQMAEVRGLNLLSLLYCPAALRTRDGSGMHLKLKSSFFNF